MKRSEVIKSISQDLEDIRIENYYDEKGSEWCANLILTKLEEINAVNRLERNGEIEVIPENEMVEFWQGFVEGQSKALHYSRKRIRELTQKVKDLQSSLIAVLSDDGKTSDFTEILEKIKNENN